MEDEILNDENYDNFGREVKRRNHVGPLPRRLYDLFLKSFSSIQQSGWQFYPSPEELKDSGLPKPLTKSRRERFKDLAGRMDVKVDPETKTDTLIHRRTGKIIVPIEEFEKVIRTEHEKSDGSHYDLRTTINRIQDKYTMGNRDFGMTKEVITYIVDSCRDCIIEKFSTLGSRNNRSENTPPVRPVICNGLLAAESCSMVAHMPDSACVWFDKSVLLPGQAFYPKLQKLITELRGEMPAIVKGSRDAKNRLLMKIYFVIDFIRKHKISTHKASQATEPYDQIFHDQVKELLALYEGKSDELCEADMRLLVSLYKDDGYSGYFIQSLEASICLAQNPMGKVSSDQTLYLSNGLTLNFREGVMDT